MKFHLCNKRSLVVVIILFICALVTNYLKVPLMLYSAESRGKTSASDSHALMQSSQSNPYSDALTNKGIKEENSTKANLVQVVTIQENQQRNAAAVSKEQKLREQLSMPVSWKKSSLPEAVKDKTNNLISGTVTNDDYFTAASAILGKLSFSEMKYIFNSATDDFWVKTSVDEINHIRSILFSRLSDRDLKILSGLGHKYGRSMTILRKDIDVSKEKEKETARRNALKK